MNKSLIPTALLLLATAPIFADSFSITATITSTFDPTAISTGTYQGSFTTSGTCTLCTVGNGGMTSFDVPIKMAASGTVPSVLVFDALDSINLLVWPPLPPSTLPRLFGALPQYNTTALSLSSSNSNPNIGILEQILSGPNGDSFSLLMEMTPTKLGAEPTTCDSLDIVRTGCITIHKNEIIFAQGTYTITAQQAAGGCPATIGFWKHHPFPNDVKQSGLTIGGITYTPSNLLSILNNNGGNAVVILGRQLVGALLNLAAGGVHNSGADTAITTAQGLLQTNGLNLLTSNVPPSIPPGPALVAQSAILDNYNNADSNTCHEGSGLTTGSK